MPKVSDEHRAAMRERIQSAALACVAHKGFSNVSMADIIAEAGLSAGAVYVYYRSKEELVVDVGRRVFQERMTALERLRDQDPMPAPAEAIPALMLGLIETEFFPGVAVQVWGEAVRNDSLSEIGRGILDEIGGHIEAYLALWLSSARGLDRAEAAAEGRRLAPAVMGIIQGFAIQSALRGHEFAGYYIDSARALLASL
ncbi:TetR/AcrR family transcriptional regulator [Sinomonas sp. P10A9]|uniref:TetR/AcrR family transcriptional regulator n=1 Tax=Sinomonas puerhi TaxID=3238584 RepID=A0AB39L6X7_9MICC